MLSAKQIKLAATVITIAVRYFSGLVTPYISEFPSVNKVGRYLAALGISPMTYDKRMIPPVPISTLMLEMASVENKVIRDITNMPSSHQHVTEKIRLWATELSQKNALYA